MNKKLHQTLALVLLLAASALHATETTSDLVLHFKSSWELEGVVKIYKLEADINNDGLNEVFLSTGVSDPPDDVNLGWQLYLAKPNGQYVIAPMKTETGTNPNSIPSFRRDYYKIAWIPEIERYGLLHLVCGRGGQALCQLRAIVIEGDAWKEIPIGEPVYAEEHFEQLAERFEDPPTPAIVEIDP